MALLPDVAVLKIWLTLYAPLFTLVYFILWTIYARTLHPLANIPGPFWPSISRTWLMWRHHKGDIEIVERVLHQQYGPILRIAPDEVVVADPKYIPQIYRIQKPLQKTDWYIPWRPQGLDSQPDLFTQTNEKAHAAYRRIVGGVYSFSSIAKNEPGMDVILNLFMERLDGFADNQEAFDFGLWLEMYAFDNVGVALFGQAFGFLKNSIDYRDYIRSTHLAMPFLTVLTVTPYYLRPVLLLVAVCIPRLLKAVLAVEDIKKSAIMETKSAMDRSIEVTGKRPDLLSQLLAIVQEKGEKVNYSHKDITSDMWVGIMAGADSTSITMRSVFYFLMKSPEKLSKVRAEVDAAFENDTLSSPAQFNQASSLPYLSAVVKETTRLFPAFSVSQPRYAPIQGIELCGKYIPAGYSIGLNPAIIQHDKGIFGADALEFQPERWLESEERTRTMDRAILGWGAGTRTCVGRPLALTQIYKVTAEVLHRFSFEMAHDQPWKTHNASFNMQTGVICKLKRRS
ncbi:cytochrome P450 [Venturia nashicola]|uniref:Cytochrome P450 n=1 Tax=Venturia nashicola TaxID=86259 RepID=A0A4Z1NQX4_9PEZI|nr:cytochrome P450 [Venturia nashicola]TLD14786.1 cytochrome P450 [Venturia nashicola]